MMSTPVIGKMHKTPCMHVEPRYMGLDWIPVLGAKHTDPILNFPHEHYHIDWRFVPESAYEWATHGFTRTPLSRVITSTHKDRWGILRAPVLKWRKCRRSMPDFPGLAKSNEGLKWAALENDQRKRCDHLIDGHCPHRGIDLRPFAKPDGTVICPGHGLRWNINTGEMLPHHTL